MREINNKGLNKIIILKSIIAIVLYRLNLEISYYFDILATEIPTQNSWTLSVFALRTCQPLTTNNNKMLNGLFRAQAICPLMKALGVLERVEEHGEGDAFSHGLQT